MSVYVNIPIEKYADVPNMPSFTDFHPDGYRIGVIHQPQKPETHKRAIVARVSLQLTRNTMAAHFLQRLAVRGAIVMVYYCRSQRGSI